MDGQTIEPVQEASQVPSSQAQPEESERKARVDAVWNQMSKGISTKKLNTILNKPSCSSSPVNRNTSKKQTPSASWMTVLGLAPKKTPSLSSSSVPDSQPPITTTHNNCSNDEAKRIAASALSAVKDAAILAASSGRGGSKIEIKEVRDFAGEEVEVKKLVDANSREASASEKGKSSAVDAVLEQIRKKPKLSVLDKTKKDWGEFKEENKLDEELDAYKKSGNQYLEKVSFLQRADYREFERERDVRLALQAKRKPDT